MCFSYEAFQSSLSCFFISWRRTVRALRQNTKLSANCSLGVCSNTNFEFSLVCVKAFSIFCFNPRLSSFHTFQSCARNSTCFPLKPHWLLSEGFPFSGSNFTSFVRNGTWVAQLIKATRFFILAFCTHLWWKITRTFLTLVLLFTWNLIYPKLVLVQMSVFIHSSGDCAICFIALE
jgi:hypothetical protein